MYVYPYLSMSIYFRVFYSLLSSLFFLFYFSHSLTFIIFNRMNTNNYNSYLYLSYFNTMLKKTTMGKYTKGNSTTNSVPNIRARIKKVIKNKRDFFYDYVKQGNTLQEVSHATDPLATVEDIDWFLLQVANNLCRKAFDTTSHPIEFIIKKTLSTNLNAEASHLLSLFSTSFSFSFSNSGSFFFSFSSQ